MIRVMNRMLIDRLTQLISEKGISAQRLSIQATGAKETVRKILDGTSKNPRIDTITKIATALDVSPQYLLGEDEQNERKLGVDLSETSSPLLEGDISLHVPVLGTVAGSHQRGAFELAESIVDYVRRPAGLTGARDIYALFVEGTSMEPQFFPGDLIYVNPHKHPRSGDVVVLQRKASENEPTEATLGVLHKITEKTIIIVKRNPPAEIEFLREKVKSVHKVLSNNEIFSI